MNRPFRIFLSSILMLLLASACTPSPSEPGPSREPARQPQVSVSPSSPLARHEPDQDQEWALPQAQPGTLGEALQKLGVTASNGLSFYGNYEERTYEGGWKHVEATSPEVQAALTALLQLKIHPDSTMIERLPRPKLEMFAGLLKTEFGKQFYGVRLDLPQHSANLGGFQVKLTQQQIHSLESEWPAMQRSDGSWTWDWTGEAKSGATVFQLEGLDTWYTTYATALQEMQEQQGKPDRLWEAKQNSLRTLIPAPKQKKGIQTVADFLAQADCDASNSCFAAVWEQEKEILPLFSAYEDGKRWTLTPWTPRQTQWYQKLLALPIQPEQETDPAQKPSGTTFQFAIAEKEEPIPFSTAPTRNGLYLIYDLQEGTDSVYLYQNHESVGIEDFGLDAQGQLQRFLLQEDPRAASAPNRGIRRWKIVGFAAWLQQMHQDLETQGEWPTVYP